MKKPNVIIIMTDDQGYGDLSCMGATDFITPNIDALADDGNARRAETDREETTTSKNLNQ